MTAIDERDPLAAWTPEEEEPTEMAPVGSTLLDTLRQKRAEHVAEHFYDMEIPGYDGLFYLRLAPIQGGVLTRLAEAAQRSKSPDKEFNANADLILKATQEVLGRATPAAELEPLVPGEVIRVDDRLAQLMEIQVNSARELLRALWDKVPSPEISIGLAAASYLEWSGEANRAVEDGFVGESATAPS